MERDQVAILFCLTLMLSLAISNAHAQDGEEEAAAPLGTGLAMQATDQTAGPAVEADGPEQQRAEPPNAKSPMPVLEEIVVTAQRREQSVQDAAVAIDVMTGREMTESGIGDLAQLSTRVPALVSNGTSTFIRGVGTFSILSYTDPAVAFNYDEVYIGRPWATQGLMFDLSRVEVLKGPQGTLYGRNATGGAVNVLPVYPDPLSGTYTGRASIALGDRNNHNMEAGVSIPVGEAGAFRLSALSLNRGATLNDDTGSRKIRSGRLQYAHAFTDDLVLRLAADALSFKSEGQGSTYLSAASYNRVSGDYDVRLTGFAPDEGVFSARSQAFRTTVAAGPAGRNLEPVTTRPKNDDTFYGVSANLTWTPDWGSVTFIPAYRHSMRDQIVTSIFPIGGQETTSQFSAEARLTMDDLSLFDVTLGAYFFREAVESDVVLNQSYAYAHQFFTSLTRSYAVFGQGTANFTDRFRGVIGLRYSTDSKSIDGATDGLAMVCITAVIGLPFCPRAQLFDYVPRPEDQPFNIPNRGGPPALQLTQGTLIIREFVETNEALQQGKVTYRGALEYDVTDEALLYGSVETGYRSGGFSIAAGYETYDPETIVAYTVGLKSRLLGGAAQLNIEAFHWVYTDQQIGQGGPDDNGNVAFLIQNVGESRMRGVELDLKALVSPTTKIGASLQYLDSTYTSFKYFQNTIDVIPVIPTDNAPPSRTGCPAQQAADGSGQTIDCSGYPAYNSPKWTLNLFVAQDFEIGAGFLTLAVDTQYRSQYYVGSGYFAEQLQEAIWRTNASVSFSHPRVEGLSATVYVRNIENNQAALLVDNIGDISTAIYSDPRTYGARLAYEF